MAAAIVAAQRLAVVTEARAWIGTAYHHMGRVQARRDAAGRVTDRGGVDCAMFIAEVYERAGVCPRIAVEHYPRDWHLHRRDERFLSYILPRAREVTAPGVADVVTYHIGLGFAHAAIILTPGWPAIIHSDMDARCVVLGDGNRGRHAVERNGHPRAMRFFSPWPETDGVPA